MTQQHGVIQPGSLVVPVTESDFVEVQPGMHRALIESIEPQPPSAEHPEYGPSFKWFFRLLDEPYVDLQLTSLCSVKVSPKSKLFGWLTNLGYQGLEPNVQVDLAQLLNTQCNVLVKHKTSQKIVNGKVETQTFSNVAEIFALQTTVAPAAAPVAATPPPMAAPAAVAPVAFAPPPMAAPGLRPVIPPPAPRAAAAPGTRIPF